MSFHLNFVFPLCSCFERMAPPSIRPHTNWAPRSHPDASSLSLPWAPALSPPQPSPAFPPHPTPVVGPTPTLLGGCHGGSPGSGPTLPGLESQLCDPGQGGDLPIFKTVRLQMKTKRKPTHKSKVFIIYKTSNILYLYFFF